MVADGARIEAAAARDVPGESPRPFSILVVDDEELVRKGTSEMLRGLGHHVREAEGGAEALAMLAGDPGVDIVVTDYKMPRMDGARRVRDQRPDMPMLLISGYTGASDPIAGLPRLNKPFGLVELADALRRVHGCSAADPSFAGAP